MKKFISAFLIAMSFWLPAFAPVVSADITSGVVSCWSHDEISLGVLAVTREDTIGPNDLTDNNTVASAAGQVSNASHLDSTNTEYFSITDASQTGLDLSGDLTVSLWTKIATLPADGIDIKFASKWLRGGNQRSYIFSLNFDAPSNYYLRTSISQGGTQATSDFKDFTWTPSTGVYYHVTFVYIASSSTYRAYVDGAQLGADQTGVRTAIFDSSATFEIGQNDGDETARTWVADVDELVIYNRALDDTDIASLYNSGTGVACANLVAAAPAAAGAPVQPVINFE